MNSFANIAVTVCMLLVSSCVTHVNAQSAYDEFTRTIRSLYDAPDEAELDHLWNALVSRRRIPLTARDSVAFLYRGQAKSITWMGDFNGWGNSKNSPNKGRRIPRSNIWILKASLPSDARIDYKILINDGEFILDPINPHQQWSGVGGGSLNSELRMPGWKEDTLTMNALPDAPRGKIHKDILFNSRELGYQITYSVYTPPRYEQREMYPVIYVTDGYEYMHERMGNMIIMLDNLIHLQKIQPVVAVFIDHREPVNRSYNRRIQELAMNTKYMNFMTRELIGQVEDAYSVAREPSRRAIIGTSLGGLAAAWFSLTRRDLFGMAGIQSPAFWFKPEIYSLCDKPGISHAKIFISTGTIHDAEEGAQKMKQILEKNSCTYDYKQVNQGHSWGNWRDLLDDMLMYLFPSQR